MDTVFVIVLALLCLYAVVAAATVARDLITGGYKHLNGMPSDIQAPQTEADA